MTGADRAGIIAALTAFRSAYESMDAEALRQVFPKFENFDTLRQSFADMRAIAVAMNPASAQINDPTGWDLHREDRQDRYLPEARNQCEFRASEDASRLAHRSD